MVAPTRSTREAALDELWARRVRRRRRWDLVYRRLNGATFALLLLAAVGYFLGLWDLLAPVLIR